MRDSQLRILQLKTLFEKNPDKEFSMADLMQKTSVDRRTLYADIKVLNDSGMKIESQRKGNSHYYTLLSASCPHLLAAEKTILQSLLEASVFLTKEEKDSIKNKLISLSANGGLSPDDPLYSAIETLSAAIGQNRKVSFVYMMRTSGSRTSWEARHDGIPYTVSPFQLKTYDNRLYLIAHHNGSDEIKFFRVDKMDFSSISIVDSFRTGEKQYQMFSNAAGKILQMMGMYKGKTEKIQLRIHQEALEPFHDYLNTLQNECILVPDTTCPEWFGTELPAYVSPPLLTWLLNFKGKIRITGPEWVVEEQRKIITAINDDSSHYS